MEAARRVEMRTMPQRRLAGSIGKSRAEGQNSEIQKRKLLWEQNLIYKLSPYTDDLMYIKD